MEDTLNGFPEFQEPDLEQESEQEINNMPKLPIFIVDNVWHLYEENLDANLQAGLISLALQEDIDDVLEQDWSKWNPESRTWEETVYSRYFIETFRQLNDTTSVDRNEFTGLATVTLKYPLKNPDLNEISFINIPKVSTVSEQSLYQGDHELAHSLRMLSYLTGKPMDLFRQLYIGDYTALREEADFLMPTQSRN